MAVLRVLILLCLGLIVERASCNIVPNIESPCSSIFQYKKDSNDWIGEVKLNNIDIKKDIKLEVEITVKSENINTASIRLTKPVKDALNDVLNNEPLVYEVIFPIQDPIPKIKGIFYNDNLICSGPGDTERPFKSIKLRKNILSGQVYSDLPNKGTTEKLVTSKPTSKPLSIDRGASIGSSDNIECGTPVLGLTQSLVFGGREVSRGQWPWLVAFYKAGRGNLEFICGGNLVSKSHVITAAHCIQDKQSNKKREADSGVVYVGRHNLDKWNEQGFQKRDVERFIVHNDWQPFSKTYDADIAIIVMDTPVEYTQYVRPLCVWEFSDDLREVVGQSGALAGWGLNENNNLNSEFPKMIEVPIVNDGTCLRSHPAIAAVSSERTFCAGGKNGEGPCKGDSGGGLILKKGDKWYLRGLVSTAPANVFGPCDTNAYAIFTDVAKFLSWIRSNTQ